MPEDITINRVSTRKTNPPSLLVIGSGILNFMYHFQHISLSVEDGRQEGLCFIWKIANHNLKSLNFSIFIILKIRRFKYH